DGGTDMTDDILFERKIAKGMKNIADSAYPDEDSFDRIVSQLNAHSGAAKTRFKGRKITKAVAAAIAACVLIGGTSAYAGSTLVSIYSSSRSGYDYTKYSDLESAEDKAKIDISAPESFSNGYRFDGITLTNNYKENGEGKESNRSTGIDVTYKNDTGSELTLSTAATDADPVSAYQAKKDTADGMLYYLKTEQHFVPDDYKPTAAELKKDAEDPFYSISYGADTAETDYISHVKFVKDGIYYDLYGFNTSLTSDEMFEMAEEIL
ncbi:MAG: hypothetical protein ACI4CS_11355, partial [Candidatus Weimeria sp.]